ncbi:SEFIR domain-containing protein [Amycolatopsis sp. NBC_01307]|uniref:SEFIR domain-containing protein n=1 Tax=Amycolatopsis sp. NBC_01307 TaxID=2903561 RepID=UPI003FA3A24D
MLPRWATAVRRGLHVHGSRCGIPGFPPRTRAAALELFGVPPTRCPRVFVSYAGDSDEHTNTVVWFAERLRGELGIDVRLDL